MVRESGPLTSCLGLLRQSTAPDGLASPGRWARRLRRVGCTSKGWGLGVREASPLSSCSLALLLGCVAGSARAARDPTLAQAAPGHRILTRGLSSTLGRCPCQVTVARGAVLPRRTAAVQPPLSEDLGRNLRYRRHGRHQLGKGPLAPGLLRVLSRHSSQGGRCPAVHIRQPGATGARPGSLVMPRPHRDRQP